MAESQRFPIPADATPDVGRVVVEMRAVRKAFNVGTPIETEVRRLVLRLEHQRLPDALVAFFRRTPDPTIQLVRRSVIDALTRANRDYDLLIATNGSHFMAANTYFRRRRWDYFVRHLIGMTPPDHYLITTPAEYERPGHVSEDVVKAMATAYQNGRGSMGERPS